MHGGDARASTNQFSKINSISLRSSHIVNGAQSQNLQLPVSVRSYNHCSVANLLIQ